MCGSAEKVENFVNGASLARIERVENTLSSHSTSTVTSSNSKTPSTDLFSNSDIHCNGDVDLSSADKRRNSASGDKGKKDEDRDSAMGTSDSGAPHSLDSNKSNDVKENGATTSSDTLSSPPLCNGHSSDTDSFLVEGRQSDGKSLVASRMNGGGDCVKTRPPSKNGFINGLEKLIADIPDDKSKSIPQRQLGMFPLHSF